MDASHLRDYQSVLVDETYEAHGRGYTRILIVLPTGAGKTTYAAFLVKAESASGKVWFIAHRKELIDQCSNRLDQWGVDHGIIQGNHPRFNLRRNVQVASVQTLVNRLQDPARSGVSVEGLSLVIIDEAHRSTASSYQQIVDMLPPDVLVLGLTATPCRLNGKPLGMFYQKMIVGAQPADLVEGGYLMEPRIFTVDSAESSTAGVRMSGGDFDRRELSAVMDRPRLVGGIVEHWEELCGRGKRTVVFGCGVEHAQHVGAAFRERGYSVGHVDAKTPMEVRKGVLDALAQGNIDIVTNCGILTEGWDLPLLDCVVLARPTVSLSLYLQMVGRVLRPAEGKREALVIDHADNWARHGHPTADREWTLEHGAPTERDGGEALKNCPQCGFVCPSATQTCPACGFTWIASERPLPQQVDGRLVEVKAETDAERLRLLYRLVWETVNASESRHRRKHEWDDFPVYAKVRFREETGRWPREQEKAKVSSAFKARYSELWDSCPTVDSGGRLLE